MRSAWVTQEDRSSGGTVEGKASPSSKLYRMTWQTPVVSVDLARLRWKSSEIANIRLGQIA